MGGSGCPHPRIWAILGRKLAKWWVAKFAKMVVLGPKIDLALPGFRPAIRPGFGELEPGKKVFVEKVDFYNFFKCPNMGGNPDFVGFAQNRGSDLAGIGACR